MKYKINFSGIAYVKADCRDKPVKHVYSSKAIIEMVEQLIELQKN